MKRKSVIAFLFLFMLSFSILFHSVEISSQDIETPSEGETSLATEYFRLNKLIINESNTFAPNDTIEIYISIENLRAEENLHNIYFNDSYDPEKFEVLESIPDPTVITSSSVENKLDFLEPGNLISFRTTLMIKANVSENIVIEKTNVSLEATEFHIPIYLETQSLSIKIIVEEEPVDDIWAWLKEGNIKSDEILFLMFFFFPLVVGLIISFVIGLRRRK